MFSIAYVNGRYLPYSQATTHIEDRGYQFGDGVYEVALLRNGKFVDAEEHLERLERSLKETGMEKPVSLPVLRIIVNEIVERSGKRDGLVYIQVTRGIASRDHSYPKAVRPSLVVYMLKLKLPPKEAIEKGAKIVTVPETRWARPDIKSTNLMPNAMAKQIAAKAGAKEAIFVDDKGFVTEGSSMNIFMVDKAGTVLTHPADHRILGGVTRRITVKIAREAQIKVIERPFSLKEMQDAAEVFLTSTSVGVMPVIELDGKTVSGGKAGSITRRLMELYGANVERQLAA